MSRYICPSCGQRFNGRKCRNCLYETYDDEISRNLHVHQEVNVSDAPANRPAQVQREWEQQKREFRRNQEKRRRQMTRKPPKAILWLLVVVLLNVLSMAGPVVEEMVDTVSNISAGTREPVIADTVLPEDVELLFSTDGLSLYLDPSGDWQRYPLFLENTTDQDVCLAATEVIVDGFLSEQSSAWCDALAGSLQGGELWLDTEDMAWAGISSPSQITVNFVIYDVENFEDVMEGSFYISNGGSSQPTVPDGLVLMDTEDLCFSYLGYQPDIYNPGIFREGHLLFYVENKSGRALSIYSEETAIDGQEGLSFWCALPADTCTVGRMYLYAVSEEDTAPIGLDSVVDMHLIASSQDGAADYMDLGQVSFTVES